MRHSTALTSNFSRLMRTVTERPRRSRESTTSLPAGPWMRLMASFQSRGPASTPSMRSMRSPLSMPARQAGEPSMGETTTKPRLRFSRSMPMPMISALPSVSCLSLAYSSGSMKRECGSSTSVRPRAAPYMSSLSGMSST